MPYTWWFISWTLVLHLFIPFCKEKYLIEQLAERVFLTAWSKKIILKLLSFLVSEYLIPKVIRVALPHLLRLLEKRSNYHLHCRHKILWTCSYWKSAPFKFLPYYTYCYAFMSYRSHLYCNLQFWWYTLKNITLQT